MTLGAKIKRFAASFILISCLMAAGAYYVFVSLGENLDLMHVEIKKDKNHDRLTDSVQDLVGSAAKWGATGNGDYRRIHQKNLDSFKEIVSEYNDAYGSDPMLQPLNEDIKRLNAAASGIIEADDPVGDPAVSKLLDTLKYLQTAVFAKMKTMHVRDVESTIAALESGKKVRNRFIVYIGLLVGFVLLTTTVMIVMVRRILEAPYRMMLDATEHVMSGRLQYRINSKTKDEFGTIAGRFDAMVDVLEKSDREVKRKLRETELLLAVARLWGMMPEPKGALNMLTDTVAAKMEKDLCAIFIYKMEKKAFYLESCNIPAMAEGFYIPLDGRLSQVLLSTLKPVTVTGPDEYPELSPLASLVGYLHVFPIVRNYDCFGMLMLGTRAPMEMSQDEKDTATIIAHNIGSTIRSMELNEETKKQLRQLGALYELSKSLTSVFKPDEILNSIPARVAKLMNAKGCIIRMIEDGDLKVRSHYGAMEEAASAVSLRMGSGIAGWVAREGKSMFVEDIEKIPDDLRDRESILKSAIVVPLSKDERIIGTLSLYDKLGAGGAVTSFPIDDLAVAEGFASISAIAIDKARMQEQEKKTVTEIQETRMRMDLLFESVQSGILTLDRSYKITSANRYIERWIDKTRAEILDKNALDIFHEQGGICPHCAAKATFEDGQINTITQSSGLNYADLASYPIKDDSGNVAEAVVFIQDITDRILYQEEIMGLYRDVMQTKEYMESLIINSADAIVTTDINGMVKSWNPAAEEIYGYKRNEVMGKFLPFIPESLMELERENMEKIKSGEVIKLDTFRKRKDGILIEVSLTLSPIKDVTGEIIGISGISRDVSDKKRVEKELIRRNQELSRLFFISSAMRGTLELDRLLRMVLTAVTMSDGLGFNRSILFLIDEEAYTLKGAMGVGPASPEEAWRIWESLSVDKKTLHEIMIEIEIETGQGRGASFLDKLSSGLEIPLHEDTVLSKVAKTKTEVNIKDVRAEPLMNSILIQQLGTEAFAAVPLISRDKVIGVLWVDNLFNRKPITDEDMKFLRGFADQVASAIEAARLFQKVSLAEAELENIFGSISDMVFFTEKDYTVKKVNQAVADKIGMPQEDIVGRKCYEVFHGMDEPWHQCPHHKTVETMKAYVEELEDAHLGGTFLTSTSPIFDSDNSFLGTVHVVRDISELKQLREKLQSSERMAALGEVAAKVAHEIRNPLVSVGGFAKRLEGKLDGNLREYAKIISNEVARLEEILKDILGFVKEVRISRRLVNLNDIVTNVLDLLNEEFAKKGNAIVKELDPRGIMLVIDPDRTKEAVLNIVTNANQATDGGTIEVKTYKHENYAVLQVTDNGCGIKDEDIPRIFDPFFTTRPTGTGLGLAISKRIVEESSGIIEAKSLGPGNGSTFKILLPFKKEG